MSHDATETKPHSLCLRLGPTEKTALIVLATLKGCTLRRLSGVRLSRPPSE